LAFWPLLGLAFVLTLGVFAWTWRITEKIRNAGFVDVVWSYSFAGLALLYAALGTGEGVRRGLVVLMAGLWSLRLGTYLWKRVRGHHPEEDGRYAELRARWGAKAPVEMLKFFLFQAALAVLLSVPFLIASSNPAPGTSALEWTALGLWLVALMGEGVADAQLAAFKKTAERGQVCEVGLWHYSRHPNYFFQSLLWLSFFLLACGSPWGWVTVYCPAAILYFLLFVTGIPATEAQALKSRGEAYRRYQHTTSAFVPWFRKK
jgi:steroid 5-alpha reductase family enzyme